MSKIAIIGLFFDIMGAAILVVADMPIWRKEFASYCPKLRDGELARKKLTTDLQGDDVTLDEGSPGHDKITSVIEQRRKEVARKGELGPIRSHELETGLFAIQPQNYVLERRVYSDDLSKWMAEWEAKYIRRFGLSILIFGFVIQIVAAGLQA